jgi:hypothetical protein
LEVFDDIRIARHYYLLHPQHFLVADRSGRSFVYEYSTAHNTEHIHWDDGVQVVTNHLLFRYPTIDTLPPGDGTGFTFSRYRTLTHLFSERARYTTDEIAERHAATRFTDLALPVRTLWYALYDATACSMDVSFYVRGSDDGEQRSPMQRFSLGSAATTDTSARQIAEARG